MWEVQWRNQRVKLPVRVLAPLHANQCEPQVNTLGVVVQARLGRNKKQLADEIHAVDESRQQTCDDIALKLRLL